MGIDRIDKTDRMRDAKLSWLSVRHVEEAMCRVLKELMHMGSGKSKTLFYSLALGIAAPASSSESYDGRYCSGKGDVEFLRLIDESFDYFHPTPRFPNISMLYRADWDSVAEGPMWGLWWVQNSYGPTFCSLPFLREPWLTFLQHSQDFWFDHQGDGKTAGGQAGLVPPDGSLCDCAGKDSVIYVQGDGDWKTHDWCYGFTCAGVLMQAELMLISRDLDAIRRYLPKLQRACDFVEARRDPKNNLFLVGPAANLLAPSYAGAKQPDGTFGKAYLAEISVTYLAALERVIELYKLTGDKTRQAEYETRAKKTRDSLPQLLTPDILSLSKDGYFVKSIDPDGTKHGVLGQSKFGYFESSVNVDAICHRAVDDPTARKIYDRIASTPQLRPHDYLITNYPSLDDTYVKPPQAGGELPGIWRFGTWVNGGVWTTLEARAIMAYYRLGKYEDVRRSALRSRAFAEDFQFDAPLKDFGKTPWFDSKLTNICYDALGVPAATVRGLFDYIYKADRLILYAHIPPSITEYTQREPIRFGEKRITLTVKNGGPKVACVKVNGRKRPLDSAECVTLNYDALPKAATVEIDMTGGWPEKSSEPTRASQPEQPIRKLSQLPKDLQARYDKLIELSKRPELVEGLESAPNSEYERAFAKEAIRAFETYRERADIHYSVVGSKMTRQKRAAILKMYRDAANALYDGLTRLLIK